MGIEKKEFEELKEKVDKILFHFESDSTWAHKGIPERLKDVENSLDSFHDERLITKGKLTVYGAIGGVASVILTIFGKWILTKIGLVV